MDDYISSNKIKENKYKILRMSLLLGDDENREETINNFEDAAREIDAMNNEIYLNNLENKFYETNKLEEEEKKLALLVDYIGGRVEQRISLLTDFANVTGFDLQNLPPIKYYDKLDDYKERLQYIREYLNNTARLETLNEEVKEANEKLEKAYKNKSSSEEFNQRSEEVLYNKYQNIIKTTDYFKDINEDNVEEHLEKAIQSANESKKSLDIFKNSFKTLSHSGISSEEEEEYRSYVINAGKAYYSDKEKEYLIRLYQYFIRKESDYHSILTKRDSINELLYERLNLRNELGINEIDILSNLYELLEKQYEDIKRQEKNKEEIEQLNELIDKRKEEINTIELENQKVEILAILREFGMIETYTNEEAVEKVPEETKTPEEIIKEMDTTFNTNNEENISLNKPLMEEDKTASPSIFDLPSLDEKKEDASIENNSLSEEVSKEEPKVPEVKIEDYQDNQVISVENAEGIDLEYIHAKAKKVMQRVGEMLGIKSEDIKEPLPSTPVNSIPSLEEKQEITIPKQEEVSQNKQNEMVKEVTNPFLEGENQINTTNPLFTDNLPEKETEQSEEEQNFWFPSETPDALNELPDLENNTTPSNANNFFANNTMPDLNFPDLKVDFGNNEEVSS